MKVYAIILNTCLAISTGCLGASYMVAGYWLIIPVILAMAIFWMTTRRSISWSASSLLSVYVVLSIIGVTLNFSIYLLALGCTTALVCWDLAHFEQSLAGKIPSPIASRSNLHQFAAGIHQYIDQPATSLRGNDHFSFDSDGMSHLRLAIYR
ncbi:hypothetical protein FBQ99_22190 [Chloroflexi bacterium CFX2]|nr:hypothetical protein [Chloroflexi bacterium CFX2]